MSSIAAGAVSSIHVCASVARLGVNVSVVFYESSRNTNEPTVIYFQMFFCDLLLNALVLYYYLCCYRILQCLYYCVLFCNIYTDVILN